MDYKQAGVDIEAGRSFVQRIKDTVASTHGPAVLGQLGGFSGLFQLPQGYAQPVLVSGTDGVGTKLKLAHALDRHDTVGIDLVAMCVNDVLTCGAEPLFFLDYIATSQLEPAQLAQVVEGIAAGCRQAGCALLGGETAEMPGFYQPQEYDLAGFCVGIVDKPKILDSAQVQIGDVAVALGSSGIHSNGFSLVRKVIETAGIGLGDRLSFSNDSGQIGLGQTGLSQSGPARSVGEVLLTPTQIYVQPVQQLLRSGVPIRGMAHITGGGLPENLPRCLAPGQSVQAQTWEIPPLFDWIASAGGVERGEMLRTFNMGIGFVVIVPPEAVEGAIARLAAQGLKAWALGEVVAGAGEFLL
ncbi:MAG: phosphoribosylformylglycinamidine cyclo-ligase [Elainellaceae cyanobacterium]